MNCCVTVYVLLTVFVGSLENCVRELTCKHYADSSTWFGLAMVEMLVSCFFLALDTALDDQQHQPSPSSKVQRLKFRTCLMPHITLYLHAGYASGREMNS